MKLPTTIALAFVFAIASTHAAIVATLPGTATQVFTTTGDLTNIGDGNSGTFNGADYAASSLTNVDLLDATFAITINFTDHDGGGRQTIFESGGGTIGYSLNYEVGNVLVLRRSGNDGGGNGSGLLQATSGAISNGSHDIIFTTDVNGPNGEEVGLYIDGVLAGSDANNSFTTIDWSGSGTAGFGQQAGSNMAGDGNNGNISSVGFSSGSLGNLSFYGDTLFVPEPSSAPLLALLGCGLALVRRRR